MCSGLKLLDERHVLSTCPIDVEQPCRRPSFEFLKFDDVEHGAGVPLWRRTNRRLLVETVEPELILVSRYIGQCRHGGDGFLESMVAPHLQWWMYEYSYRYVR